MAIDAVDLTPAVMEWPDVNDPTAYPTFQDYAEATERWLANLSRDLTKRERLTFGTLVGVPGEEIIALRDARMLISSLWVGVDGDAHFRRSLEAR